MPMQNELKTIRDLFSDYCGTPSGFPKAMMDALFVALAKAKRFPDKKVYEGLVRAVSLFGAACEGVETGQRAYVAEVSFLAEIDRVIEAYELADLVACVRGESLEDARVIKGAEYWEFFYRSQRARVKADLIGLQVLEVLLRHPHRKFSHKQLRVKAGLIPKTEMVFRPMDQVDAATLKHLQPEAIENYLCTHYKDPAERAEAREEITKYIRRSKGLTGRTRNTDSKHYKSVNESLNRIYKVIEGQSKILAGHFRTSIFVYSHYSPDERISWIFE
jgi:hypothetical protein